MENKEDEPINNVYGAVCYRKERRKRQKTLVIELLFDYAKNSTLHGLRYIADKGFTFFEKAFWFVTFAISFVLCFILIYNVYIKWKTSPVIVSFSEHVVPVGKVPFPSVTICPQLKSKSSIYNYTEEYSRLTKSFMDTDDANNTINSTDQLVFDRKKLYDIGLICDQGDSITLFVDEFNNASTVDNIREVSPDIDDTISQCFWKTEEVSCSEIFVEVLTREGVCFNFNAMAAKEILNENSVQTNYSYLDSKTRSRGYTLSDGYIGYDPLAYPRQGAENGAYPDLQVILVEKTTEKCGLCNSLNNGYKIYVQHPSDLPQSTLYYYAALPKQVSSLALKFNMISTADSLKDYLPEVRQCYFPHDRPLRYFNIYTANNCRLECQSNYTYKSCGCVAFHMPHHDSRKICTVAKKDCMDTALSDLSREEILAEQNMDPPNACRCFPECQSVYYDAEILKTEFDYETYFNAYMKVHNMEDFQIENDTQFSKIDLYFKEPRFVSMRRSELFGLTDFMANCGGLLGLFLGFSFLSLVEIFYFITIRLCCILKRDLKEEKENRRKSIQAGSIKSG